MSDGLSADRLRGALNQLVDLVTATTRAETDLLTALEHDTSATNASFSQQREEIEAQHRRSRQALDDEFRERKKKLKSDFDAAQSDTEREFRESLLHINEKAHANEQAAKKALQEAVWLTETVFDATENQPQEQFELARKGIEGRLEDVTSARDDAAKLLRRYRQRRLARSILDDQSPSPDALAGDIDPIKVLDERHAQVRTHLDQMATLATAKLFIGVRPAFFVMALVIVTGVGALALNDWQLDSSLFSAAGIAAGLGAAVLMIAHIAARSQLSRLIHRFRIDAAALRSLAEASLQRAEQARERGKVERLELRDREVREAHEKYEPIIAAIRQRRDHHIERINDKYPTLLAEQKQKYADDKHTMMAEYDERLGAIKREHDHALADVQLRQSQRAAEIQNRFESQWSDLTARWNNGTRAAYDAITQARNESARLFPAWDQASWASWSPPNDFAPAIRFGQLHIDLAQIPGGIPKDERLPLTGAAEFDAPALLSFPDACSLVVQAGKDGRAEAVQVIQTVMFRLLSSLPPGKVRFTIIDPVGLGENFAGFMHLADYDGAYVTDRIWTEDRHIEQRLLDLTEHMENVIQKYLRNQYETIAQYNEDAGEIAEPFRFLVIANFPVNFTENAARRLASIVGSGPRCGVYTLITADTRQPLPQGIQWDDLTRDSVTLAFEQGRFVWKDDVCGRFPLAVDPPPNDEFITGKLHAIGEAAKDSSRVEVPFDVIAPTPEQMWTLDTTGEVRVALGRAGATKFQHLALGQGTSQHALIAGKTGSGKSTLLHAMITNLSLWYSPDEVEFYLIDFKKGVEFKTYATHQLPHARAVAIESDREFGLSVLQRLDGELKRRGNIFRDLGVQDLAGYRRADGKVPLPRVLLIVDEFQELFTEDDKIAQDSMLLLDRLVRQGRAFGMHVILGSQTLGGAYTLARSTINQMAVRIALQCSEADSYLILSDDNAAARLLSRPGEAIYNDASGMVEGNNPFQIVWLPDEKRETFLQRVAALARQRHYRAPEPQIVFEGNVPADVSRNRALDELLKRADWPAAPSAALAWLGEPIAIKDPTAVAFRRQSGSNLLMVGQRDEAALAMMAMALISLAARHAPGAAQFLVLDGTPADAPGAGVLAQVAAALPHQVRMVSWRDVPQAINDVAQELAKREASQKTDVAPIYFLVHALQRFRMLRQEEDFGFSSSGDGESLKPDKQFGQIIREGPVHGIHVLTWCDTAGNLNRCLDRQSLREFESRVLFQMGATDSSNLIDSPAASKLGLHRALFFSEEQGVVEKFRPYAVPDARWLNDVAEHFKRRGASPP
jgi:S-DNA-T family DNA segregation ATPase FtsK/SpoIIIE